MQDLTKLLEQAIGTPESLDHILTQMEINDGHMACVAFYTARAAFQSELPVIHKHKTASFPTRNGGTMTYNYASLDDIAEAIKPLLAKHGFSYRWEQSIVETGIKVKCVLTHSLGRQEICEMVGRPDDSGSKNHLQQTASTVTYLRRYTLTGVLGIATAEEDVDGKGPEQPTGSETVNQILQNEPTAESVLVAQGIHSARSVNELKEVGKEVGLLPDGKIKEGLKTEYLEKLKTLKEKKA
jgi:hypothetical protein